MNILGYNVRIKRTEVLAKAKEPNNSGKQNPAIIKIAQSFKDSSRKDIDKWRQALQLMQHPDEPKFQAYYDLVDDLKTDGHLQSQIQMRKMSTSNTDFHVINRKTKEVNEELTFTLQQQWFYDFLEHAIDHILYGTTLVEFSEFKNEKIKHTIIPRRNVVSTHSKIFPDLQKPQYIDYADDMFKNWLIQIGKSGDIGILNNIIPNLIWLRNVMQAWAEFCEKFGLPLITATTSTTDTTTINNVHKMLLELGQASVGTFPHGTEIKFQEANRTDAYNTYLQFIKTNADMVSKQLVGSTMLSDQGSNRSQTEVHERTLDNKIAQADKRLISFIVNDQLFLLLQAQGYKISPEDMFEFKAAQQQLPLKELWTVTKDCLDKDFDIPYKWITKTFNIPIEGKKKTLTPNKNQPIALSKKRYPISCCPSDFMAIGGSFGKVLTALRNQLIKELHNNSNTAGTVGKMIVAEALELFSGLKSKFSSTTQYTSPDLLMLQMMEYNLFEFTASKTEARLAAMTNLLIDKENKKLREYNDFKALCEKETKNFDTNYLQTEYNLSVAVGQNSANYLRMLAEKDTVTSYVEYQTIGDENVRNSHRALDGRIFSLNDKEAMDLVAPNGYGCRCEFVQYLGNDAKEKVTSGKYAKELLVEQDPKYRKSQFEINRADLKQVFTKKQFYSDIKGLPDSINKMSFDAYGLKPYASFKDTLKELKIDQTITGDNVNELFKKVKKTDFMSFDDYLGRKMILKETVFKENTQNKHLTKEQQRDKLFPHLKGILNNPDEVWYHEHNDSKFKSKYLKFYKDTVIVIDCELDDKQGLQIKSWSTMKDKETKVRKGLKIK